MFGIFLIQAFEIIYKLVLIYNRVSEKVWFGVKTLSETSLEKTWKRRLSKGSLVILFNKTVYYLQQTSF